MVVRQVRLMFCCGLLLSGCSPRESHPTSVQTKAGELTAEVARGALLERIRSSESGPLAHLDAEKIAAAPLQVDADRKRAKWGPFTLDIEKGRFYFGLRDPQRKDGHVVDFKGNFERRAGRWVVTSPTNAP